MRAAGLAVLALSTDRPEDMLPLEKRLKGRITFLSDRAGKALDVLGLRHKDGIPVADAVLKGLERVDISLPATMLVGREGRILYVHRSRRIDERPPVAALLAAYRAADGSSHAA